MTDSNDEHDRIRAAIGTLLDDAPSAPEQLQLTNSTRSARSTRWVLSAAAAAVAVVGVVGLVAVDARDTPSPIAPRATSPVTAPPTLAPTTSPATMAAPSTEPLDPDIGDVGDADEFRTQTEDFLEDTAVEEAIGGDISDATCDTPTSVAVGTTYRCVAEVEGVGQYEFDVRITAPDAFEVSDNRPI